MPSVISVVGWDRYQHYKDRDPPWVKLYRDILTTESWVLGNDTSRLLQVASILLAARYSNQIPLQWTLIRKVASLDCSEKEFNSAVSHLCNTKFFEIQSLPGSDGDAVQSASTVLATCTTETEQRRAEKSREERAPAREPPPAGLDLEAWNRWITYRTQIRKPIKPASILAAQQKLAGFGSDQAAVVEQSVAQGWTGLFELKESSNGTRRPVNQPRPSAVDRVRAATEKWLRDGDEAGGTGVVVDV